MLYAEWEGRKVTVYTETKRIVRKFLMPAAVVGVQVSGDSETEGRVAIAMDNGRTWLYKTNGQLIRK